MRRVLLLAGILSLVVVGACSSEVPADSTATITGRLVAGPRCPVETDPPDPECAAQVVPNAEIVATLPDGAEIRARSGQDGRFHLVLPAGVVTITFAAVEGLMIAPDPITATVQENQTLDLGDVTYDTGIR
jgi:type 1 fimbria pilin